MDVQIDVESGVPIYMQLVDRIKQMVASGKLQSGQQLPTMRQLAADLRINYNTVGRAYAILDQEGVISTQQGRGTFIASRLDDEQIQQMRLNKLRSVMAQLLQQLHALGYLQEEITEIFHEQLAKAMSDVPQTEM
jgi:GntR family transcriptional regulator